MKYTLVPLLLLALLAGPASASDVGKRFPSEKKEYTDEVTGLKITVLTSSPANDVRIYQTHPQWTADGSHIVFRTQDRSADGNAQAFAVNEESGDIIQITDGPGLNPKSLTLSHKEGKLFYLRSARSGDPAATELVELSLDTLLADSAAGTMKDGAYERVVKVLAEDIGGMALDADEKVIYIRHTLGEDPAAPARQAEDRRDGKSPSVAGVKGDVPGGIRSVDLATGEVKKVLVTDFTIGHLQANPKRSGELTYCHETGGDAPQRMWITHADGTGNRPLYKETPEEWITHETFCAGNEVMFNILGHEPHLRHHPTGIAVIDVRTNEVRLLGQPPVSPPLEDARGFWHCNASPDGRWAVGDTFSGNVYVIDRQTGKMTLLTTDHKMRPDHAHPAFSHDSQRVLIQSGHLSGGEHLDLMIVELPESLRKETLVPQ